MTWRNASSMKELLDNLKAAKVLIHQDIYDVMMKVDRKLFSAHSSYNDAPQGIGYSVTISAPHMHATALESLRNQLKAGARVLDVGSGSGYLTACMGLMVRPGGKVIGVEHIKELVEKSIQSIRSLDETLLTDGTVNIVECDGRKGSQDLGPFDAIHVGAACPNKPDEMISQLKKGGVLIAPVGGSAHQTMIKYTKEIDGNVKEEHLMDTMSSGVRVDNECIEAFNRLKMLKKSSFVIYGFSANCENIVVIHEESRDACPINDQNDHYHKLVGMLEEDKVGYAVTILHYEADKRPQSDIVFINWAPGKASIKQKMLAASSVDAIKPALVGVRASVQANSKSDLELDVVIMDKFRGTVIRADRKKAF